MANSGVWQMLEILSLAILQFFYIGIMARELHKPDFGLMALANSVVLLGSIISEGGLGAAIIQRKDLKEQHRTAAIQFSITIGLILFSLVFLLSRPISELLNEIRLVPYVQVLSLNFLFVSVSSVLQSNFHRSFNFRMTSLVGTVAVLVGYTVGVIMAKSGYGVWSLVCATITISFVRMAVYWATQPFNPIKAVSLSYFKDLIPMSVGTTFIKSVNYVNTSGVNLAGNYLFGLTSLGILERSMRINTLPAHYLGTLFDRILFPSIASIQRDLKKVFSLKEKVVGIVLSLSIPIALLIAWFSHEIIAILLGPGWEQSAELLQIMIIALPVVLLNRLGDAVLRGFGDVSINLIRKLIFTVVLFSTMLLTAAGFSLKGTALALVLAQLTSLFTYMVIIKIRYNAPLAKIFIHPLTGCLYPALFILGYLLIHVFIISNLYDDILIPTIITSSIYLSLVVLLITRNKNLMGRYLLSLLNMYRKQ